MDLVSLTPNAYHLRDGSNAGLIVQDGKAVLIDAGLDKDTARKILRAVEGLGVRLVAAVITHAHADHFGGAATVRVRAGVPVYAPAAEAAIIENPLLEPLYLFSGAAPVKELRHKFTLAEPCPVDHRLPAGRFEIEGVALDVIPAAGHAPGQVMVGGGGALFMGDACFAPAVLQKHGISFYVDVDQAADSLKALAALDGRYACFVPGHGPAVAAITPWVEANLAHLAAIRAAVRAALAEGAAAGSGDAGSLVAAVAARFGLEIANPVSYWLTQTTIFACLSALQAAGEAVVEVKHNRLLWRPAAEGG